MGGPARALEVVGGWGKTENRKRRGGGAQPSESVPVEKKIQILITKVGIVGSKTKIPRMDLPNCPGRMLEKPKTIVKTSFLGLPPQNFRLRRTWDVVMAV